MPRTRWQKLTDRFGRLFGDDIFISHSHEDAAEYGFVLASRLGRHLEAYVDRLSSKAGKDISAEVMDHLMRATMLVVVATPGSASKKSFVGHEVEEFARTGRQIIAVDVGKALQDCPWKDLVTGLSTPAEEASRLKPARPSAQVRASVLRSFTYITRAQLRRRLSLALVTTAVVVSATLGGFAWLAGLKADEADHRQLASLRLADIATKTERRARHAADAATEDAERQRGIAAGQRIATRVEDAWRSGTASVDEVLLAAAESLRRGAIPAAFRVISEALPVRPRRVSSHPAVVAERLAISPDERWVAVFGGHEVAVFDLHTRRKTWRDDDCAGERAVFDVKSARMAYTCYGEGRSFARVVDLATATSTDLTGEVKHRTAAFFLPLGDVAFIDESGDVPRLVIRRGDQDALDLTIRDVFPAPKGESFVVQNLGRDLEMRNGETLAPSFPPFQMTGCIYEVIYSGDGQTLAVAASNCEESPTAPSEVVLYDTKTGQERGRFPVAGRPGALAVSQDGGEVAVVTESKVRDADDTVLLGVFRQIEGKYQKQWTRPLTPLVNFSIAFLPPARQSESAPVAYINDYELHVAGEGGRELLRMVSAVQDFVHTRDRLITADFETISVWHMPPPQEPLRASPAAPRRWRSSTAAQRFLTRLHTLHDSESDDGRYVLLSTPAGGEYESALIDLDANREVDRFPDKPLSRAAISSDGSRVAYYRPANARYEIFVRDTRQKTMWRVDTHLGVDFRSGVSLSPDGSVLAISVEKEIEIRESRSGRLLWRLETEEAAVDVRFAPDGARVAIASGGEQFPAVPRPKLVTVAEVATGNVIYQGKLPDGVNRVRCGGASTLVLQGDGIQSRTISIDPIETAKAICRTVGARLSADRWEKLIRDTYTDTCGELLRPPQPAAARLKTPVPTNFARAGRTKSPTHKQARPNVARTFSPGQS